ncbi:putative AbiEii toxin of type IV toxin-antitoxin system [Flavobacterium endophyticum]|uniref:Putative AbiEii toxin of type IV toxin-antitoxin system n=1 Tax=Flavobacterium endophyticum TaxID=1540163 RepID=A0A495MB84_9FLAO|nr:AAA family ATPase [Flavobacterium endophyticum]RKS23361.1 putative AbiEii toxin of type IV toxin-antitoxin system [Flavobacterium endophyticum]
MINEIPEEILNLDLVSNDLSILIGENGSGKSTLLNNLSKHFLSNGKKVIAIANSIHDKFDSKSKNFKSLRGRSGRKQSRNTLKNSLKNIAESDEIRLKNASTALKYVGFEPEIGFKIVGLKDYYEDLIMQSDLTIEKKNQLLYLIVNTANRSNDINWFMIDKLNFNELKKFTLIEIFLFETLLRKLKIINRIEVFLKKGENIISMLEASSGELVLITSIIYISTMIDENTVILIDEPENSLHPKWQKEFSKILFDIFYYYQPKIIIATHSPIIINGAELNIETAKIFKAENFEFILQKKELLNVEEMFYTYFDVTTPENRFLSERLIRYFNLLVNQKMSISSFEEKINEIIDSSYDPKQINVLRAVIGLGEKTVSNLN